MSTLTDAAFAAAHDALFAVFGEPAIVRRGRGTPVPVRVVITYNVSELGDYSQGLARVTTVTFKRREWSPRSGDILHVPDGRLRIDRVLRDDGLVVETVLHG